MTFMSSTQRPPQIVAFGGGGFSQEAGNPLLDDYVLSLTGVDRPKVCFLPTASGDADDEWIAVEIKRIATIEAVEQLTRYLEFIRRDPAMGGCRGVLAAQQIKPQARTLAESRGIACVEVDLAVLRGEREPELTLFG